METAEQANARLDEQLATYKALDAQLDQAGQQLVKRLDELRGEDIRAEGDRILALAAWLCVEAEELDLFERLYSGVLFGDAEPGAAAQFARSVYATRDGAA